MSDDLLHAIIVRFAGALGVPVNEVEPETEFFRAGGGSLRALVLIRELERDLNLRVPRQRFWLGMTPMEIVRYRSRGTEDVD
jgi:acyl carrier protein